MEREFLDRAIKYELDFLGRDYDKEYTVEQYEEQFPNCCRIGGWSRGLTGYYNLSLNIDGPKYKSYYTVSKYGVDWVGWPKSWQQRENRLYDK